MGLDHLCGPFVLCGLYLYQLTCRAQECILDPGHGPSLPALFFSCDGRYDEIDPQHDALSTGYNQTDKATCTVLSSPDSDGALEFGDDGEPGSGGVASLQCPDNGSASDRLPGSSHAFPITVVGLPLSAGGLDVEHGYGHPRLGVDDVMGLFSLLEDSIYMAEHLLFLRSVLSIELRPPRATHSIRAEISCGSREYRAATAKARSDIKAKGHQASSVDLCHYTEIVCTRRDCSAATTRWCISQHLSSLLGDGTRTDNTGSWDPRIGIAALVAVQDRACGNNNASPPFRGRLFDPLPSLSTTSQPVHVYGVPPPGCRLPAEDNTNSTVPEMLLARLWSSFLLDTSPQLTPSVAELYFRYWPRRENGVPLAESLCNHTFSHILSENLPLFPTFGGERKGLADVVVYRTVESVAARQAVEQRHFQGPNRLHCALLQLKLPLAYVPDDIYDAIDALRPDRQMLTPVTASVFLTRNMREVQRLGDAAKGALLDYLLSRPLDEAFDHLIGIPLIPTYDGQWKALEYLSTLKLPANEREMALFGKRSEINVDVLRLSRRAFRKLEILQADKLKSLLHPWLVGDLAEYLRNTYFENIAEERLSISPSELEPGFGDFVRELWRWVLQQPGESDAVRFLEGLWLIPVVDGTYQKIMTVGALPLQPTGPVGDFFLDIVDRLGHPVPIVDSSFFQPDVATFLKTHGIVWDSGDPSHLLRWLEATPDIISPLGPDLKGELSQHLVELLHGYPSVPPEFGECIGKLSIFREIENAANGIIANWISLRTGRRYVAVCMDLAVPETPGVIFLHGGCTATRELLEMFGLAECPNIPALLTEYVIPAMSSGLPTYIVERLGHYVLDNFSHLARLDIETLRHIPFVPARTMDGTTTRLVRPSKCVDRRCDTRLLYLEQECVWVENLILAQYAEYLSIMGMVQSVNIELVLERVATYIASASTIEAKDIAARAEALILASGDMEIISSMRFSAGRWLPARNGKGELCLQSPLACRDKKFAEIVGHSMDIVPFDVGPHWSAAFRWAEIAIPSKFIQAQIEALTLGKDISGLEKVLAYISDRQGHYVSAFKDYPDVWIPSESGAYFRPSDIFFEDFAPLEPFCSSIRHSLHKYEDFLRKVGVTERPSFEKLREMTESLGNRGLPLKGRDLESAILICSVATKLYPEGNYTHFKAPDWQGVLCDARHLVAEAPHLCEAVVRFAHPSVPADVKTVMRIPSLGDALPPEAGTPQGRQALPPPPLEPLTTQLDGPRERERTTDRIEDVLGKHRTEDAFSLLLSYIESLGGATFVEWRLEDGEDSDVGTETSGALDGYYPRLFLVTDGGMCGEP